MKADLRGKIGNNDAQVLKFQGSGRYSNDCKANFKSIPANLSNVRLQDKVQMAEKLTSRALPANLSISEYTTSQTSSAPQAGPES